MKKNFELWAVGPCLVSHFNFNIRNERLRFCETLVGETIRKKEKMVLFFSGPPAEGKSCNLFYHSLRWCRKNNLLWLYVLPQPSDIYSIYIQIISQLQRKFDHVPILSNKFLSINDFSNVVSWVTGRESFIGNMIVIDDLEHYFSIWSRKKREKFLFSLREFIKNSSLPTIVTATMWHEFQSELTSVLGDINIHFFDWSPLSKEEIKLICYSHIKNLSSRKRRFLWQLVEENIGKLSLRKILQLIWNTVHSNFENERRRMALEKMIQEIKNREFPIRQETLQEIIHEIAKRYDILAPSVEELLAIVPSYKEKLRKQLIFTTEREKEIIKWLKEKGFDNTLYQLNIAKDKRCPRCGEKIRFPLEINFFIHLGTKEGCIDRKLMHEVQEYLYKVKYLKKLY